MSDRDTTPLLRANEAKWDARAREHVGSAFYALAALREGQDPLADFEWEALGDLRGRDVVHLQCHLGNDTIALARAGASVVAVDFSATAIELARVLAEDCGVSIDYVHSDVHDSTAALQGRDFDVLYTGKGALNWLPDLTRWARVVHSLLRPDGRLCLVEFHPVASAADEVQPDLPRGLRLKFDYRADDVIHSQKSATYTGGRIDGPCDSYEWAHGLGDVINALVAAGMRIDALHEHSTSPWTPWAANAAWVRMPAGAPNTPLLYTLQATRER